MSSILFAAIIAIVFFYVVTSIGGCDYSHLLAMEQDAAIATTHAQLDDILYALLSDDPVSHGRSHEYYAAYARARTAIVRRRRVLQRSGIFPTRRV